VLRTEKAINDIAVHPLPASFYESGGLEKLRQRFDHSPRSDGPAPSEIVNVLPYPRSVSQKKAGKVKADGGSVLTGGRRHAGSDQPRFSVHSLTSSRTLVQAGDLLSMVGHPSETFKPKSFTGFAAPLHSRRESTYGWDADPSANDDSPPLDDFNLKEEVMSCIAKSIGLIQPPSVGDELLESPPLPASDSGSNLPRSSYGSLSLLEMVNDGTSSVSGASSMGEMTGLDNEVEIRFFPAGSTLIHAGERNAGTSFCFEYLVCSLRGTGMFYVIEGFLDVILPVVDSQRHGGRDAKVPSQENIPSGRTSKQPALNHESRQFKPPEEGKHLFTVKPGGIAGYLCEVARKSRFDHFADQNSIVVQHGLIRGHQGKDGHMRGIPSSPCLGTVARETSHCPPDAC
jgi:lysophospholipid hydrolase